MGRATARAPMEEPSALNAPLFKSLAERFTMKNRQVVLDLGTASSPMLSLLGRGRTLVQIADLAGDREIDLLNGTKPGDALNALAHSLLPAHATDEAVDVVFCWDLPNYLKKEAMLALMEAIAARSCPGTVAHALIVYSERTMPDRPRRYLPTHDDCLVNHSNPRGVIDAPRYSPEALGELMVPFEIDRARLLANGMQEFLFTIRD